MSLAMAELLKGIAMITSKRLFISSNYLSLLGIASNEETSIVNEALNDFPKTDKVSFYSSKDKKFVPFEQFNDDNDETTIFLIHQDLCDKSLLIALNVRKEGFDDYLLYHVNHTKQVVIDLFNINCCKACHHEKLDPNKSMESRAFAIALQDILDNAIPADKKAEKIIEEIWPSGEAQRKVDRSEGLRLLKQYQKQAPSGDCPPVFNKGKEMKEAYDDLTTKTLDDNNLKDYTDAHTKLSVAFYAYYY